MRAWSKRASSPGSVQDGAGSMVGDADPETEVEGVSLHEGEGGHDYDRCH